MIAFDLSDLQLTDRLQSLWPPGDPQGAGTPDESKPGLIVDGQQRTAAIRDARVDSFPICATAFIAGDQREQREQFILVNSTKPLPKGLIYELLPETEMKLPALLQKRRFPARLLQQLNSDQTSPLRGMIRTPTTPNGVIQDNSILKMIENSLSDGVLYRYRDPIRDAPDTESMMGVLYGFWQAAAATFPGAWGLPPAKSRLMHGAGIISMGFLMDAIADRHRISARRIRIIFAKIWNRLRHVCRWTDGYWDFGAGIQKKWNEVQNTPKDIQTLANLPHGAVQSFGLESATGAGECLNLLKAGLKRDVDRENLA